jgi:hypothetical protein
MTAQQQSPQNSTSKTSTRLRRTIAVKKLRARIPKKNKWARAYWAKVQRSL